MPRSLSHLADTPVTVLKGVGPERAKALHALAVDNVLDLLTYYPRRYLDRTREARIADLRVGEEASVFVEVKTANSRRTRNGKSMVMADVTDASGRLRVTFFNQPWRERQLRAGMQAVVFGKLDVYQGRKQMTNPVVDLVGDRTGMLVPVYPQSDKARVYTWDIARWLDEVLERAGTFADPLPQFVLDRFGFVDRTAAFRGIHHPESMTEKDEARRRLVFDELFRLQLALVLRKRALERRSAGIVHDVDGALVRRFHERLPYVLTAAQTRVIGEIERDLARPHPMHRLLQGDVGSGKTVVAVSALLVAVQGGHQGALMAPTEVLAEQHALGVRALLDGFTMPAENLLGERPLQVDLLTGRTTPTERKRMMARLESGEADILIGTHALIEQGVAFRSLGVVVVDEQHRFGVEQRAALREKGAGEAVPDVLVMTATPIPRTAAMTVYGDLDVSILDELPPGREPIATSWEKVQPGELTLGELSVWAKVREDVAAGRQAYVVCPLIEESEKLDARSAEETYDELSRDELSGLRLGLLHGRMTAGEKEKTMALFRSGAIDALVSTTVIEVGVDVPNATVMVILDADRFGIAQLHQLRGRVGRGPGLASTCVLVGAGATPEAEQRLEAMVQTQDGFLLAEVDLEIRGEGTIMGERQKGRSDLKLASLRTDREWVSSARDAAIELVDADPSLADHPQLLSEIGTFLDDEDREYLLKG
ncbi:MAG TPA: ATP-dependent DNA helicase RecG [Acidimicrobiales bacterium]